VTAVVTLKDEERKAAVDAKERELRKQGVLRTARREEGAEKDETVEAATARALADYPPKEAAANAAVAAVVKLKDAEKEAAVKAKDHEIRNHGAMRTPMIGKATPSEGSVRAKMAESMALERGYDK